MLWYQKRLQLTVQACVCLEGLLEHAEERVLLRCQLHARVRLGDSMSSCNVAAVHGPHEATHLARLLRPVRLLSSELLGQLQSAAPSRVDLQKYDSSYSASQPQC